MWDTRFAEEGFAYGTEPNDFLREHAGLLAGPVLSLAEGQGRNAVYLAGLGLDVTAVDGSAVGLGKAQQLAQSRQVTIKTIVSDLDVYDPGVETFAAVVSIFAHVPSAVRRRLHQRVMRCLRPGGRLLLEAYTPAQVARGTGGPQDADRCMPLDALLADFAGLDFTIAHEIERTVQEGRYHTGSALVVQILATKPEA